VPCLTLFANCRLLLPPQIVKSFSVDGMAGRAVGIELKATLKARKLLISLNVKSAKNSKSA
jgi:hypothetical protein